MLADFGSEFGTFEKEGHIAMITAFTQMAPLYCVTWSVDSHPLCRTIGETSNRIDPIPEEAH